MNIKNFFDEMIAKDDHFVYDQHYDFDVGSMQPLVPKGPYASDVKKKLCWYDSNDEGVSIRVKYNNKTFLICYYIGGCCSGSVEDLNKSTMDTFESSAELVNILTNTLKLSEDKEVFIADVDKGLVASSGAKAMIVYDHAPIFVMKISQIEPYTSKKQVFQKFFTTPEELADIHKAIIDDFVPLQIFCRILNK